MKTIKLTYTLELEVPEEALVTDGDAFVRNMRCMLASNVHRGWKCHLRRLLGVDRGGETQDRNRQAR